MTQALEHQQSFIDAILPRINEMRPGDLYISINVKGIKLDGEIIRENFDGARARVSSGFSDFYEFQGTFRNKELFEAVYVRYREYLNSKPLCPILNTHDH